MEEWDSLNIYSENTSTFVWLQWEPWLPELIGEKGCLDKRKYMKSNFHTFTYRALLKYYTRVDKHSHRAVKFSVWNIKSLEIQFSDNWGSSIFGIWMMLYKHYNIKST